MTANDIAEILVEHASDFRMSDFLEDTNVTQHQSISQNSNLTNPAINVTQRKNSDVGLIAGEKCFQFSVFSFKIQIEILIFQ